jgi:hypothetical protein
VTARAGIVKLTRPASANYRLRPGNVDLLRKFVDFCSASEVSAPGNAILAAEIANFKPGIAFPGFGITIPGFGNAIPSLGNAIPCPGIVIPNPGNAIPEARIAIPRLGIAIPKVGIAFPKAWFWPYKQAQGGES